MEQLGDQIPAVYVELRRLARSYLRQERGDHTLEPTALVHEAFLRLSAQPDFEPRTRQHFLGIAANAMRRVLVEHARARNAEKRGGHRRRITLHSSVAIDPGPELELLALDEALEKLTAQDPRQARIVELHYFAGLTLCEIGELLAVSLRTVEAEWALARAWLRRELLPDGPHRDQRA